MRFYKASLLLTCSLLVLSACGGKDSQSAAASTGAEVQTASSGALMPDEKVLAPPPPSTAPAAVAGEPDTAFRLLKLERQMTDLKGDFNRLLPPLSDVAQSGKNLDASIAAIRKRQEDEAAQATVPQESAAQVPAMAASPDAPANVAPPPPAFTPTPEQELDRQMTDTGAAPAQLPPANAAEAYETALSAPEAAPAPQEVAPAAAPMDSSVTGVRVGEHPPKTRIVLDVTKPVKFSYDIDNNENILTVSLPGAEWASDARSALKNPLLKGYSAQANAAGDGATVVFELARPVKALSAVAIGPSGEAGERIVLDIAPL